MNAIQPSKFARFNRNIVKVKIMALQMEEYAVSKEEVRAIANLSTVAREVQDLLLDAPVAEKSNRGRKAAETTRKK